MRQDVTGTSYYKEEKARHTNRITEMTAQGEPKRSSKEIAEEIRRNEKEYYDFVEESKAKITEMNTPVVSYLQTEMRKDFPDLPDYYLLF